MFFPLHLVKKLNLSKKKYIALSIRSLNISKFYFFNKRVYIDRGLYPVRYYGSVKDCKAKFGMFSFTRKPFAIPEKKTPRRKR